MAKNEHLRMIQYLGSKINIIPYIKDQVDKLVMDGSVVVDIFAGTGVVGNNLKDKYKIIANDIQEYSYLLNKVLLDINDYNFMNDFKIDDLYNLEAYKKNKNKLCDMFSTPLKYEEKILKNEDVKALSLLCESGLFYNNDNFNYQEELVNIYEEVLPLYSDKFLNKYKKDNKKFPYILFTLYYSNGYFGLKQSIEIDSLRYAIDSLSNKNYKEDQLKQVLLACLTHSISETVSSVGKHFAQPIKTVNRKGKMKPFILKRCLRDRKRKIKEYIENMYYTIKKESKAGKFNNEVYNMEYNNLLTCINNRKVDLFYIDPPYTIDHYSRFYHIPETLIKYDYPDLDYITYNGEKRITNGRYRTNRFQSNFCIPSKVEKEFDNLIKKVKTFNSKIIISYSDEDEKKKTRSRVISKDKLLSILNEYYDTVDITNIEHKYRKLNEKNRIKPEVEDAELLITCY